MKENSKKKAVRKTLAVVRGFASVVKDGDGNIFVRTRPRGANSVQLIHSRHDILNDIMFRTVVLYNHKSVAELYADETSRKIFSLARGNGYRPNPPFEAMAVPVTFKLG